MSAPSASTNWGPLRFHRARPPARWLRSAHGVVFVHAASSTIPHAAGFGEPSKRSVVHSMRRMSEGCAGTAREDEQRPGVGRTESSDPPGQSSLAPRGCYFRSPNPQALLVSWPTSCASSDTGAWRWTTKNRFERLTETSASTAAWWNWPLNEDDAIAGP